MQHLIAKNEAEVCGRVPLHQTNLVQPHGYLLVANWPQLQLVQVSENAATLLGLPAPQLVQTSLADYFTAGQLAHLREKLADTNSRLPFVFAIGGNNYLATAKKQEQLCIIEVEAAPAHEDADGGFLNVYQQIKFAMAAIEQATTLDEAGELIVQQVQKLSGFDKVMLYRFDDQWNGDVISEATVAEMDKYLGLKFPASDVPRQARELYKQTAFRHIPDTGYQPVRLYPVINPVTNTFTNLSDSNLRSVAAVHLEYLANMKVQASMSTRVVHNNELWGLIACHHRTPRRLSFQQCAAFELLSYVISQKISSLISARRFSFQAGMHELQSKIVSSLYSQDDVARGLNRCKETLAQALSAKGVSVVINGKADSWGEVPPLSDVEDLVMWLQAMEEKGLYHQHALPSVFEPAEAYSERSSGLLALPIQPDRGSYILAFRPEEVSEVNWGGNPGEAVQFEADGIRYHPRASFDVWKQTVRNASQPWSRDEQEAAETLRNIVVNFTLRKL